PDLDLVDPGPDPDRALDLHPNHPNLALDPAADLHPGRAPACDADPDSALDPDLSAPDDPPSGRPASPGRLTHLSSRAAAQARRAWARPARARARQENTRLEAARARGRAKEPRRGGEAGDGGGPGTHAAEALRVTWRLSGGE